MDMCSLGGLSLIIYSEGEDSSVISARDATDAVAAAAAAQANKHRVTSASDSHSPIDWQANMQMITSSALGRSFVRWDEREQQQLSGGHEPTITRPPGQLRAPIIHER